MNKRYRLAALAALFFTLNLSAQFELEWQKIYGFNNKSESTKGIIALPDGGVVAGIARNTNDSGPLGNTRVEMIRYDASGNQIWQTTLGNPGNDHLNDLVGLPDGSMVMVGQTNTPGERTQLWVVKLNSTGTVLWEKKIGGSDSDWGTSILPTSDGGYLLTGKTASTDGIVNNRFGSRTSWVVKLDANGNVQWNRTYGGFGVFDDLYSAVETPEGDFVIGGGSFGFGEDVPETKGDYDFWVFKINPTGDIIWSNVYGGFGPEAVGRINLLADGSMILSGHSNSHATGDVSAATPANTNFWIVKIDANGTLLWEKTIGGDFFENYGDTQINAAGEIFIVGSSNSTNGDFSQNNGEYDIWVLRLDPNGNVLDKKNYGGSKGESASVLKLNGNNLIVGGSTSSNDGDVIGFTGGLSSDAWILNLKTQSSPPPPGDIDLEMSVSQSTPNPAQWSLYSGTFTVTNTGNSTATNVAVGISTGEGTGDVTYQGGNEFTASQGTVDLNAQRWVVGSIPPNSSATLTVNLFLLKPDAPILWSQVTAADQFDPDSTPDNRFCCNAVEDDEATTGSSTPPTCVISAQVVSADCDDNGTPNDPTDDTFDLFVEASGVNISANFNTSGSIFVGMPTTTHAYGTNVFIANFSIENSGTTINLEDSADSNCQIRLSITKPLPCSSSPVLPCNGNLITNGDFENGVVSWTGGGASHQNDPSRANSGSGSLQACTGLGSNGQPTGTSSEQAFPVTPNVSYEVSFYAQNFSGGGTAILSFYRNDGTIITNTGGSVSISQGLPQYQNFSFSATAPSDAVEGRIRFFGAPFSLTKCIKIDDVCVVAQTGLPLPDLEITNVQIPSTIVAGEDFVAEVTVRNNGFEDFNQTTLIQALVSFGIVSISPTPILNLPSGGSQTFTIPFTMLNFPTARTETMKFNIDILDTTTETDETNNDFDVDFQLIPPNTGGDIDLELSLVQNDPNPRQWGFYSVTATIENKGDQAANGVTMSFPAQAGVTYKGGDEFTASQGNFKYYSDEIWTVGTIPAGGSATLEVSYFLLQPNAPAAYAQVLTANEIDADSTPGNGSCCTPNEDDEASTTSTPPPTLPDLFLEDLKIPNAVKPGEILDYTFDLRNGNPNPIPGDFTIRSFISTNQILGVGDIPEGDILTGNIGGNANIQDVPGQSTIPSNLPPGNYFLIVNVDAFQDIPETNDLNNLIIAPFTVMDDMPPPGGADLVLAFVNRTGDTNQWGSFSINLALTNTGTAAATGVKVALPRPDEIVYQGGNEVNLSQGSFKWYGDEVWEVGTIAAGSEAVMTLNYFRTSANEFSIFAQVTEMNEPDVDSTPGNGTCCNVIEDDETFAFFAASAQNVSNRSVSFEKDDSQVTFLQNVFPNPTSEQITLRMIAKETSETEIQIVDNFGRVLHSGSWNLEKGVNLKTLNVSDLPSGIYQVLGQPFHPYLRQARFMKVE